MEEHVRKLEIWKEGMDRKGLQVNVKKKEVMVCGTGLGVMHKTRKYPCGDATRVQAQAAWSVRVESNGFTEGVVVLGESVVLKPNFR